MNSDHKDAEGVAGRGAHPRLRITVSVVKWTAITTLVLFGVLIIAGIGGIRIPFWFPDTEVTNEEPYSNFVGREFRVSGSVTAMAWNDFPDKAKILVVWLTPSPTARNRFVSHIIPLQPGQRVRILSAWRSFELFGFTNYYLVSVPGAGLPEGVPVKIAVNTDGLPDPQVYEALQSNNTLHRTRAEAREQLGQLAARADERERYNVTFSSQECSVLPRSGSQPRLESMALFQPRIQHIP